MADADRELLALAAKAYGAKWTDYSDGTPDHLVAKNQHGIWVKWVPLEDDGQALRLAVKLRIKFRYNEALGQGLAWTGVPDFEARANIEDCGRDETACARRAIVHAAAEIGRAM